MITFIVAAIGVLLLLGMPVAFAIGLSSAGAILLYTKTPLLIVIQKMFAQLDSFPLLAVPFFILAGTLMDRGGISRKLIDFAMTLIGHIRGGLPMVSTLAGMFFASISGSAQASTAAIGSVLIPSMKEKGYHGGFCAAVMATSGSIGVIIPPSIPMVIFALTANVSIGRLFFGGYIPGVLVGLALIGLSYLFALRHNFPTERRATGAERWKALKDSIWAFGMAVIIMGGIICGIFTATEASVIAVVYAVAVGMFVYKNLKPGDIPAALIQSGVITGICMFCVATTAILGWLITREQIPAKVAAFMIEITANPAYILLMINVIYLFAGTILDTTPAILLLVPIFLPLVTQLGVDPTLFGVITVINLAIGMCTPPVGVTLFVACSLANEPISKVIKTLVPYIAVMVAVLMLITYVPQLVLWIPNTLMPE
ncbi:MAG: TRAP transporter large permease [Planctomycetota bacterium]|jgi:C4-dicarboxylate transporter DctM subunit|nr:TRAP transporter large permease [Planctomycetota bacterium]